MLIYLPKFFLQGWVKTEQKQLKTKGDKQFVLNTDDQVFQI